MKRILFGALFILSVMVSCKTTEKMKTAETPGYVNYALDQTIVYKTIGDFNDLVPVTMDAEKTRIVSYPAPSDLVYDGHLAKPTALKNGYLLDNRGISVNSVFLKFTYEEYNKMPEAPSLAAMMQNIAEKHPFVEMYHCGPRMQFTSGTEKLNALVDAGFPGCTKEPIVPFQIKL